MLEISNVFESQEVNVDVSSKEGIQRYLSHQMMYFHFNYDFESDTMMTDENDNIPEFLFETHRPTEEEVYYYTKYVVISGKMEREIPLMALVYIERFVAKTGILLNHLNWRRIILITLIIASKIWDDDSLENIHFPKVMHDITVKEVNALEKIFLELISFDLHIRGSEYAKYFFVLKTLGYEDADVHGVMQMEPISVDKMNKLQQNAANAETLLRYFHQKSVDKELTI